MPIATIIGGLIAAGGTIASSVISANAEEEQAKEARRLNELSHESWLKEFEFKKNQERYNRKLDEKKMQLGSINNLLTNNIGLKDRLGSIWAGRGGR